MCAVCSHGHGDVEDRTLAVTSRKSVTVSVNKNPSYCYPCSDHFSSAASVSMSTTVEKVVRCGIQY